MINVITLRSLFFHIEEQNIMTEPAVAIRLHIEHLLVPNGDKLILRLSSLLDAAMAQYQPGKTTLAITIVPKSNQDSQVLAIRDRDFPIVTAQQTLIDALAKRKVNPMDLRFYVQCMEESSDASSHLSAKKIPEWFRRAFVAYSHDSKLEQQWTENGFKFIKLNPYWSVDIHQSIHAQLSMIMAIAEGKNILISLDLDGTIIVSHDGKEVFNVGIVKFLRSLQNSFKENIDKFQFQILSSRVPDEILSELDKADPMLHTQAIVDRFLSILKAEGIQLPLLSIKCIGVYNAAGKCIVLTSKGNVLEKQCKENPNLIAVHVDHNSREISYIESLRNPNVYGVSVTRQKVYDLIPLCLVTPTISKVPQVRGRFFGDLSSEEFIASDSQKSLNSNTTLPTTVQGKRI